jgi:flagellar motor switch protein FliG
MRMLRIEAVTREVIDEIERVLRSEFMNNLAKQSRYDTHEAMSEIFNGFPKQTGERYLALLEERNRESAEKIRGLMFQFDDLIRLDPSGVQTLMRAINKSVLSLAMKGAPEQLRDLFFSNMSERAAKMLREEIESLGPVRGKDVAAAQASIVTTAKALADKEEIFLSTGAEGGEDDLIY